MPLCEVRLPVSTWMCGVALVALACAPVQPPASSVDQIAAAPASVSARDSLARIAWLRRNVSPLRSLDPDDEDFADLAPLGRAIGDARIVFLGEASHGEGGAYLAKTRLIKYLHQKLGFDVLVFEGSFYESTKAWEALLTGMKPVEALAMGVPPAWSWSAEIEPLAAYLAAQAHAPRPLRLAGYDPQSGRTARQHLPSELRAYLNSLRVSSSSRYWRSLSWLLSSFRPADSLTTDSAAVDDFVGETRRLRAEIAARSADERSRFWQQLLESTAAYARQGRQHRVAMSAKDNRIGAAWNTRDEQGARNLLWLANDRFRGHRLIVWSATIHAARNVAGVDTRDSTWSYAGVVPTGDHVWRSIGREMYALGVVALSGSKRLGTDSWRIRVDQHPAAELEELLAAAGFQAAFLNFRGIGRDGAWLREPLLSRPFAEHAKFARWPDVLDGIVFMREMQPATWPDFEARMKAINP